MDAVSMNSLADMTLTHDLQEKLTMYTNNIRKMTCIDADLTAYFMMLENVEPNLHLGAAIQVWANKISVIDVFPMMPYAPDTPEGTDRFKSFSRRKRGNFISDKPQPTMRTEGKVLAEKYLTHLVKGLNSQDAEDFLGKPLDEDEAVEL